MRAAKDLKKQIKKDKKSVSNFIARLLHKRQSQLDRMQLDHLHALKRIQIAQKQQRQYAIMCAMHRQKMALLQLQYSFDSGRQAIVQEQEQLFQEIKRQQQVEHAEELIFELANSKILNYEKISQHKNNESIISDILAHIIELPHCPRYMLRSKLSYIASQLRGHFRNDDKKKEYSGKFAQYIDHSVLDHRLATDSRFITDTTDVLKQYGFRYVEEGFKSAPCSRASSPKRSSPLPQLTDSKVESMNSSIASSLVPPTLILGPPSTCTSSVTNTVLSSVSSTSSSQSGQSSKGSQCSHAARVRHLAAQKEAGCLPPVGLRPRSSKPANEPSKGQRLRPLAKQAAR